MSHPLRELRDGTTLERALAAPLAVLYKHSTRCGVSSGSLAEMRDFAELHPQIPVYIIDVIADRDVARRTADATGVRHASPQVVLLESGRAVWDTSHFAISCRRLERALDERDTRAGDDRVPAGSRGPE